MIPSRLHALLLPLLLLAGCTLIPRYERPALPVPARFPVAAASSEPQSGVAADIAPQDFFADERLNQLIRVALSNNRDLRIAVLDVEQSRAQFQITRSAAFPTVQGSAGFTRQMGSVATQIPGFSSNATYTSSTWDLSVGVTSYELDLFGHVRSQNAQALEQYFSTEEARRAALVTLVSEVATQYFTLREAEEQLRLAQETLSSVQGSYEINQATFRVGQSNELDLRQAEGQVQTAQLNIETYQRQMAEARDALELLLGAAPPEELSPPRPFSDAHMMAQIPPGLPADLVSRRPDILEAEHTLKAANANIGIARAAFFPTIALTGSAGLTSPQLSSLFRGSSRDWSLSPQITVPIFTGGKNRAQLQSARAAEQIQLASYEKTIQTAFREVSDALVDNDFYAQQILTGTALVTSQSRRLELATLRYRSGEDTYLNELTAQQDLYSAQQGLIESQFNKLASQIALFRALGGGWNTQGTRP